MDGSDLTQGLLSQSVKLSLSHGPVVYELSMGSR